jgi:tripartite-type tricarboxylate transporter receptor subunit TctC
VAAEIDINAFGWLIYVLAGVYQAWSGYMQQVVALWQGFFATGVGKFLIGFMKGVVNAMIGGQIQLALLPPGLALPQVKAGKLKAIGITSSARSALVPDVASLDELGVTRSFRLEVWNGVAAPATLPAAHIAKLSALVSEIARSPEVRQKLTQQGWDVAGTSAEGLAARIKADAAQLGGVITSRGIKAE